MNKLVSGTMALLFMLFMSGCTAMHMGFTAMTGQHKLDKDAIKAYDNMITSVVKNGNPAKVMMKEYKVSKNISADDVKESIVVLAKKYNMKLINYEKIFEEKNAKPNEVKEAKVYFLTSPLATKTFLNHSRYFGGFMPCRIIYIQYGNGNAYLITKNLTLAIHGGYPLPPKLLTMANKVKKAMLNISKYAAQGDF